MAPATAGNAVGVERAREVAAEVRDPEMPMLTLVDLGVLRDVRVEGDTVVASITPTYSGCPAMATMRDDLVHRLTDAGFPHVEVRVVLEPAWSSDWITPHGRAALHDAGLSAPGPARHDAAPGSARDGAAARASAGPITLTLGPIRRALTCPRCGSSNTRLISEFGATACKALYRCADCLEPFDHVKEI
ncbi:1,2-phenylacetyl-CoA epoxidase subunit PaaD [Cryptosporangium sp. NPDC048952]|uniref:1,2-phenylacetyl-CoA epoxidase subunit PaaD n=1 Tax=Cryptosporangium sp. NPDC048952 TaxID=3363961 RepID=UPI0037194484